MEENKPQQDLNNLDSQKQAENSAKIEISKNLLVNLFIILFGIVLILFEAIFIRNTDNSFGAIEITITTVTIVLFVFLMLLLNNKRMMNLREELIGWWRTILKLLISGPMVSLYLTAAGGFIGYQITEWLNQEELEIVGVVVKPKPLEIHIEKNLNRDIEKIISFNDFIDEDFKPKETELGPEAFLDLFKKIHSQRDEIQDKIDVLNQSFSMQSEQISFIRENWFYLDNLKERYDIKVGEEFDTIRDSIFSGLQYFERKINIPYLNNHSSDIKNMFANLLTEALKFIDNTTKRLINHVETHITSLENRDFQLEVLVVNNGGKQSVLRYKALLLLDEDGNHKSMMKQATSKEEIKTNQKPNSLNSYNYIIVEPQGYSSIFLQIENDNIINNLEEIDRVKKAYNNTDTAWITLFDVENKPIGKYPFELRDDLELDPNRYVKKIIKEYKLNHL